MAKKLSLVKKRKAVAVKDKALQVLKREPELPKPKCECLGSNLTTRTLLQRTYS